MKNIINQKFLIGFRPRPSGRVEFGRGADLFQTQVLSRRILIAFLMCAALLAYTHPAFSLANPASVNCAKQGFQLVLIKSTGICIFPDGTYCEEWAFFKGNCTQGKNAFPGGKYDKQMLNKYCLSDDKPPVVELCQ